MKNKISLRCSLHSKDAINNVYMHMYIHTYRYTCTIKVINPWEPNPDSSSLSCQSGATHRRNSLWLWDCQTDAQTLVLPSPAWGQVGKTAAAINIPFQNLLVRRTEAVEEHRKHKHMPAAEHMQVLLRRPYCSGVESLCKLAYRTKKGWGGSWSWGRESRSLRQFSDR